MRGAMKPGRWWERRVGHLVLCFSACSLVFSVCRLVTQTANTVITPEAPGGHLQLTSIRSYVNQAFLRRVFFFGLNSAHIHFWVDGRVKSTVALTNAIWQHQFLPLFPPFLLSARPSRAAVERSPAPLTQELRQARRWKIDVADDES